MSWDSVLKERKREGATEAERIGLMSLEKRAGAVTLLRATDDAIVGTSARLCESNRRVLEADSVLFSGCNHCVREGFV